MNIKILIGIMKGTEHYETPVSWVTNKSELNTSLADNYTWYETKVSIAIPTDVEVLPERVAHLLNDDLGYATGGSKGS